VHVSSIIPDERVAGWERESLMRHALGRLRQRGFSSKMRDRRQKGRRRIAKGVGRVGRDAHTREKGARRHGTHDRVSGHRGKDRDGGMDGVSRRMSGCEGRLRGGDVVSGGAEEGGLAGRVALLLRLSGALLLRSDVGLRG
jgi:hypothetical protein